DGAASRARGGDGIAAARPPRSRRSRGRRAIVPVLDEQVLTWAHGAVARRGVERPGTGHCRRGPLSLWSRRFVRESRREVIEITPPPRPREVTGFQNPFSF